jgi:hypothetical protein
VILDPRRRRARRRLDRRMAAVGVLSLLAALGGAVSEYARVWRRGSAPLPTHSSDVLAAAEEAVRETVQVARVSYRESPAVEAALFNLLLSFLLTFGAVRTSTAVIRRRGTFGPFRNLRAGNRHIHHFVPGIVLAFLAGGVGLLSRDEELEPWLAIPFGAGVALTLDESALLLELEDVYWTEKGVLSLYLTSAAGAALGLLAASRRLLRRGEAELLSTTPPE